MEYILGKGKSVIIRKVQIKDKNFVLLLKENAKLYRILKKIAMLTGLSLSMNIK